MVYNTLPQSSQKLKKMYSKYKSDMDHFVEDPWIREDYKLGDGDKEAQQKKRLTYLKKRTFAFNNMFTMKCILEFKIAFHLISGPLSWQH